jgi:hypothetical protein
MKPGDEAGGGSSPVLAWLHVRTGLHRGARVALHAGSWALGSAVEDDLALHDDGIQPAHLRLEIDAQQLALRASLPGWSVREAPLAVDRTFELPHHRWHEPLRLALGSATLDVQWADHVTPAAPPREWRFAGRAWRVPQIGWRTAAWAPAAMALLVTAGWGWQWLRAPAAPPTAASPAVVDPQVRVRQRLAERPEWRHVVLAALPGRGVELSGRVERREQLDELLADPALAALAPQIRVLVEQDLRRQVHELTGDGTLAVALESTAAPDGTASAVPALPVRQRLVISGSTQRAGVAASLKLLNKELGERVEVVDRTLYEPNESDRKTVRVELPIRIGVVNSGEGYIEDTSGNKYFEGSSIRGHVVESIDADKVVFNVSGKRIEFKVQ